MCMNEVIPLILVMGLIGGISSLLMIGSILGFQKSRRLKKQVAEAKAADDMTKI